MLRIPKCLWLLLCLIMQSLHTSTAKQLVLFAGPHKSGATSIEKFFHNHASGYQNAPIDPGLEGWIWPPIEGDLLKPDGHHTQVDRFARHKVFNFLVTETQNSTLQMVLLNHIQIAWDFSEHGIILGTEEFDRIGDTPDTHYDGLKAMQKVVDHLRVPKDDVTVVLNYRTPRLDQWVSIFKHATNTSQDHYKHFLCNSNRADKRWELLDTAMNPLKLANVYRREGWKVVLIDMGGVLEKELDVAHVVSCDVLENTDCQNGWLSNSSTTYHENSIDRAFDSLYSGDQEHLEQLFRERDCHYQSVLENDEGFTVLHPDTLWEGCLPDQDGNAVLYEKLATDTTYLMNAMKSQKGCEDDSVKMGDLLVGDVNVMTAHTVSKEDLTTAEQEHVEETMGALGEEPLVSRKSKSNAPLTTSLFLLVALLAGMYQLTLMHNQGREGDDSTEGNSEDGQEPQGYPALDNVILQVTNTAAKMQLSLMRHLRLEDDSDEFNLQGRDQELQFGNVDFPTRNNGTPEEIHPGQLDLYSEYGETPEIS
jgi:hypothetical protein